MSKLHLTLIIAMLICQSTLAQSPGKYERKSISYVNALWLATPEARKVKNDQVAYMLDEIKDQIEIPRFDYNPLPEQMIDAFVREANAQDRLSVDGLATLMEQKLAPIIITILEGAVKTRGGELVSESQRQSFLATKAKELGITLPEIEKVMNSAYIYLPVLTNIKKEKGKQEDKFVYTVEGGIIWFHVGVAGDTPTVTRLVASTTESKGFGSDRFAYESAVDNFARNLLVATKEIAEFKLSAPIVEISNGDVTFPLGGREGLRMDDCYLVGEWKYGSDNKPNFSTNGWVRVGKVGDNNRSDVNRSSAWAVKRGSWAPGMTVVEHPRLPIDIAWKIGAGRLRVGDGLVPVLIGSDLHILEYDAMAPSLDLDAHYNVAPVLGRQTFLLVGGNITLPATMEVEKPTIFTVLTTSAPFVWGLHGGFVKKHYFGQLALTGEAKFGAKFFTVEQKFSYNGDDYTYTIKNNSLGFQVGFGVDYAATPDWNIGAQAGYKSYSVSDTWDLTIDPLLDNSYLIVDDRFPVVNHSGPVFGIYLHYTPPALTFDPVSYLRGMLGE